jgi:hypothetical protein
MKFISTEHVPGIWTRTSNRYGKKRIHWIASIQESAQADVEGWFDVRKWNVYTVMLIFLQERKVLSKINITYTDSFPRLLFAYVSLRINCVSLYLFMSTKMFVGLHSD